MTFNELLDAYFKACLPQKKRRTQETELSAARNLREFFGEMPVERIRGADVVRYRLQRGVGALRIMRELSVASAAFNWAISDLGLDISNPYHGRLMSKADRQALSPPRKRSLTRAEIAAIRVAATPRVFRDIIDFAVNTGLRQSEITGLTVDRLHDNAIWFSPEENKTNRYGKRALNSAAQAIVDRQPKTFGYVFTYRGGRITRNLISRWFSEAAGRAGVEDARFHDLRRTCGTRMLQAGATMETVKTQLGHLDIRTTQNNYADDDFEAALNAVEGIALDEDGS